VPILAGPGRPERDPLRGHVRHLEGPLRDPTDRDRSGRDAGTPRLGPRVHVPGTERALRGGGPFRPPRPRRIGPRAVHGTVPTDRALCREGTRTGRNPDGVVSLPSTVRSPAFPYTHSRWDVVVRTKVS